MPNWAPQRQRDRLASNPRDVTSAPGGVAGSALLTPRYSAGLTAELSARLPLVSQVAPGRGARPSGILLVALEEFDRDTLRPADEADPNARPDGCRFPGELDALGPDLGGYRVDIPQSQSEMIEPLIGGCRRAVDAVSRRDRRDENVGAAKFDVDPPGATDDYAAEDILKPGSRRLRIGTAQMNMVPGHDRHHRSPLGCFLALAVARSDQFRGRRPAWPSLGATGSPRSNIVSFRCNLLRVRRLMEQRRNRAIGSRFRSRAV